MSLLSNKSLDPVAQVLNVEMIRSPILRLRNRKYERPVRRPFIFSTL